MFFSVDEAAGLFIPLDVVVRGDVMLEVNHRPEVGAKIVMFRLYVYAGLAEGSEALVFRRDELDGACNDPRFADSFALELLVDREKTPLMQLRETYFSMTLAEEMARPFSAAGSRPGSRPASSMASSRPTTAFSRPSTAFGGQRNTAGAAVLAEFDDEVHWWRRPTEGVFDGSLCLHVSKEQGERMLLLEEIHELERRIRSATSKSDRSKRVWVITDKQARARRQKQQRYSADANHPLTLRKMGSKYKPVVRLFYWVGRMFSASQPQLTVSISTDNFPSGALKVFSPHIPGDAPVPQAFDPFGRPGSAQSSASLPSLPPRPATPVAPILSMSKPSHLPAWLQLHRLDSSTSMRTVRRSPLPGTPSGRTGRMAQPPTSRTLIAQSTSSVRRPGATSPQPSMSIPSMSVIDGSGDEDSRPGIIPEVKADALFNVPIREAFVGPLERAGVRLRTMIIPTDVTALDRSSTSRSE
eukprot:TRINITY_DN143_c0_g1_i2.p2 TRINITY_DN143_c0_g1~~TRINITY_DN143_c0_g1_i2.p2  ORF type:complete len:470 (-),score=151.48 TRINITY_DN143_c0_g1_i2:1994-3403(-)